MYRAFMWLAKVRLSSKGTLIGSRASFYKVSLFAFPLSYGYFHDHIRVQLAGTLFGSNAQKKRFIKDLKTQDRVLHVEVNADFFIAIIKEPKYLELVYQPTIFHIEPFFISCDGYEIVHVGCFSRGKLQSIVKTLEKKYDGKLLFIKKGKVKSLSVVKIRPELTVKQAKAFKLAIERGYYHVPRKIDVQGLAKLAELSFSTFQVHLRKAEQKLMPYSFP